MATSLLELKEAPARFDFCQFDRALISVALAGTDTSYEADFLDTIRLMSNRLPNCSCMSLPRSTVVLPTRPFV